MSNRHLLILVLFFSSILSSQATTFKAISDGDWSDNIWDKAGYPGVNDDVIIDGYDVKIPSLVNAEVNSLTLTNTNGLNMSTRLTLNEASLTIGTHLSIISNQTNNPSLYFPIVLMVNSSTIQVNDDFIATKKALDTSLGGIMIETSGNSSINVFKNMSLEFHPSIASVSHKLSIANSSTLTIQETFTNKIHNNNTLDFSFSETAQLTAKKDVILEGTENSSINFSYNSSATSSITGNLLLSKTGMNGVQGSELNLNAGTLNVYGDLILTSDNPTQIVSLHLDGLNNTLSVGGTIEMNARDEGTLFIIMDQTSNLEIAKNIDRMTSFGNLFMAPSSLLIFNFDSLSTLPSNEIADNGADMFEFTNIKLINKSGDPIELDGPMTLTYNLDLDEGILKTDSINILILEEGATITGAGQGSYIDGPVEKRGASTEIFLMPVGNKGIYAPIEINPVSDPNSIYRIQFFGDPPPIGGIPPQLNSINEDQHWIIDRVAGSEPIDVVMHWTDGEESGISGMEMDSITTVYLDPSTNTWVNGGRGATTGSNGPGEVGSISTDLLLGDPPPIGAVSVTIGTVSTASTLPVELLTFGVQKKDARVRLNWTTISEINASHFELERSSDGISFTKLGSLDAIGEGTTETHYNFEDKTPESGINYYRLRSVDLDGSTNLSRILSVVFQLVDIPIAVPNPVGERLQIIGLNLTAYSAIVAVYTPTGKLLFQQEMGINNGEIELNMQDINVHSVGTYFLRVIDTARTHNITILKSK